ncbi:MAG TPA: response regulator transcription factor [Caldilineaceae bacterium]|nr:response regulator transcription factor [Caldilineaceae bacterium]
MKHTTFIKEQPPPNEPLTQPPIRVMVVDDQAVVRSGLNAFLSIYDELALVGEANDGAKAVNLCGQLRPDVILMDLMMPRMNGVEATIAIRKHYPNIQIIALTSFAEAALVTEVLEAGAIGYLLKNVTADELADAIYAAHAGSPTLAQEATQSLMDQMRQGQLNQPGSDLTQREVEVLRLMVAGLNNTAIAEELIISRSTVKFHVSNVLSKLQVPNRMKAISYAIRHRLAPT